MSFCNTIKVCNALAASGVAAMFAPGEPDGKATARLAPVGEGGTAPPSVPVSVVLPTGTEAFTPRLAAALEAKETLLLTPRLTPVCTPGPLAPTSPNAKLLLTAATLANSCSKFACNPINNGWR